MYSVITFRLKYFIATITLLITEICIALFVHDNFVRPYIGDVLVVILIYSFIQSFFKLSYLPTAIAVLIFSYIIELLQYFNIVEILGWQHSKLARTIIGTSSSWQDIFAYSIGIAIVIVWEKIHGHNFCKTSDMKKIFSFSMLLSVVLISCNTKNSNSQNKEAAQGNPAPNEMSTDKTEKKVSSRNTYITRANAYSNLFFDSTELENFITENNIPDSIARRIRSFYNTRNYQYAWFSSTGLTEQALGFWNLRSYTGYSADTTMKNPLLKKQMDALMAKDSIKVSASDKSMLNTELLLTRAFISYVQNTYEKGFVTRKESERFIPFIKEDAVALADSLLTKKHKSDKYFDDVNKDYKALKTELTKYVQIVKSGGWPQLTGDSKAYKKGTSSAQIAVLKKRLQVSGDMPAQDTSSLFDDTLVNAVKQFQKRLGLTQDGVISSSLIKDLNVTAEKRLQQLLINLNRMRWMLQEPQGRLMLVNIPEFILHVFEGKQKAFDMIVVVGKDGHNTMMFTGKLSQVVFSPYWNLPTKIVKQEIMPKMRSNPNYLAQNNMEITGNSGGIPSIRQLPGEKNSLGRVKFLFPNSFSIYFHDTPSKSLFSKDKRAFSHGCIRLSEPEKMADYLLQDNPVWPPEKIKQAMNSGNQQMVNVKNPVPVFITYYTAWVDENGLLNFRDDIYKHDADVAAKMFK